MNFISITVKSKATGQTGTITGISGNKLSVSFDGRTSISAPLDLFDIDPKVKQLLQAAMGASDIDTADTYVKRTRSSTEQSSGAYKKIDILDAKDRIEFYRVNDVLNTCFGTDYKAWMKATWPVNDRCHCWFPKLVKTLKDDPAAYGCVNVISADWNTLVFDDHKTNAVDLRGPHRGLRIVFAREPDNGPIMFRGVYVQDEEKSTFKHYVFNRIATKIRIIGSPAYDIELLDKME